jgi:hypothetical protein
MAHHGRAIHDLIAKLTSPSGRRFAHNKNQYRAAYGKQEPGAMPPKARPSETQAGFSILTSP